MPIPISQQASPLDAEAVQWLRTRLQAYGLENTLIYLRAAVDIETDFLAERINDTRTARRFSKVSAMLGLLIEAAKGI